MTATEIKELIEDQEYTYYGIRKDGAKYSIGDTCENSHSWSEDQDRGELEGTCAVGVTAKTVDVALKQTKQYFGKHLYIIASDSREMGEDAGEYIMSDAKVVGIIE